MALAELPQVTVRIACICRDHVDENGRLTVREVSPFVLLKDSGTGLVLDVTFAVMVDVHGPIPLKRPRVAFTSPSGKVFNAFDLPDPGKNLQGQGIAFLRKNLSIAIPEVEDGWYTLRFLVGSEFCVTAIPFRVVKSEEEFDRWSAEEEAANSPTLPKVEPPTLLLPRLAAKE